MGGDGLRGAVPGPPVGLWGGGGLAGGPGLCGGAGLLGCKQKLCLSNSSIILLGLVMVYVPLNNFQSPLLGYY